MKKQTIIIENRDQRKKVLALIAGLDPEKPWEVTVAHHRKKRTNNQNKLMWMWITEVAEQVEKDYGQDKDDVHEFFKQEFLEPTIKELFGKKITKYTTTTLDTAQMKNYTDKIFLWASELGMVLTHPDDLGRDPLDTRGRT